MCRIVRLVIRSKKYDVWYSRCDSYTRVRHLAPFCKLLVFCRYRLMESWIKFTRAYVFVLCVNVYDGFK